MLRTIATLAISASGVLCAQPATPRFEVASVKPSNALPNSAGVKTGHGRLDASNVTLKRLIIGAYGIGPHQVSGGPDWLESDRFDISAKADQPVDDDAALMLMLRDLLADRFKLALHRETRIMQALVLEVTKNGPAPGESRRRQLRDQHLIHQNRPSHRCTQHRYGFVCASPRTLHGSAGRQSHRAEGRL